MKQLLKIALLASATLTVGGCDDFFNTNPDDIYNADDYMSESSELYSGYLGIITRMQEVGDHAIFLTDLRADYLEPTEGAPQELTDIYQYGDLQGNSHADPKGYYNLIIACNDYLQKAFAYREKSPQNVDETHFAQLIGGALRFKAWSYFMLGKIYGKAVWFDDPMLKYQDISKFPVLNLDQILTKCLELLNVGVNGIDGSGTLNWAEVIDPENPTKQDYLFWGFSTPRYEVLLSELSLWTGDYQTVVDKLVPILNAGLQESSEKYTLCSYTANRRNRIFGYDVANLDKYLLSAIPYDADNGQTNRVMTYFEDVTPAKYYLRPSLFGVERYQSQMRKNGTPENPGGDGTRGSLAYRLTNGHYKVPMFYAGEDYYSIYDSDVHINIYRSHDLHFMLIEALNHLGNWRAAKALFNDGFQGSEDLTPLLAVPGSILEAFGTTWKRTSSENLGVRGCPGLVNLPLSDGAVDADGKAIIEPLPDAQRVKEYDMALLDEALLEFPCEAKVYPMMIRMARRYNWDLSIITDRVCQKYPDALKSTVKSKIESGEYFVQWQLN